MTWSHSYRMAIVYALGNPGYRARAKEFAQSNGLLKQLETMKVGKEISKAELRREEHNILTKVLEENLNVTCVSRKPESAFVEPVVMVTVSCSGGYRKPRIADVLLFQLILL